MHFTDIMSIPGKWLSTECQVTHWWNVNIGSGNDVVLPGNKTLPEPVLTQICVVIWLYYANVSSSKINDDKIPGEWAGYSMIFMVHRGNLIKCSPLAGK